MDKEEFAQRLNRLTKLKPANTRHRAEEYLRLLTDDSVADYPVLDGLAASWEVLSEFYGKRSDFPGIDDDGPLIERYGDSYSGSPLEAFLFCVEMGFYPPPELVLAVADGFRHYMDAAGDKSLDMAFFGEEHKKKSSLSFQAKRLGEYRAFHWFYIANLVRAEQGEVEQLSQEELAEDFLKSELRPPTHGEDIETFLRGYRRWKESASALAAGLGLPTQRTEK